MPPATDIATLRRQFSDTPLGRDTLADEPVAQFSRWFDDAVAADAIDPNAMSVATVAADGQPSLRTVLLKYYDRDGFVFYTNLESRKAREIDANPRVALLFYWAVIGRQVKITGSARRVGAAETLRYFITRPRDSRIGAWVSAQSRVITARAVLENRFAELKHKFADGEIPLPAFWGGFRIHHETVEFWQARNNRLHDRFRYRRDGGGDTWQIERLAP